MRVCFFTFLASWHYSHSLAQSLISPSSKSTTIELSPRHTALSPVLFLLPPSSTTEDLYNPGKSLNLQVRWLATLIPSDALIPLHHETQHIKRFQGIEHRYLWGVHYYLHCSANTISTLLWSDETEPSFQGPTESGNKTQPPLCPQKTQHRGGVVTNENL